MIKLSPQTILEFLIAMLFLVGAGITVSLYGQRDIPNRPNFQTSVYDDAGVLSSAQKNQLEQKLINYADTTSTQIVVVTINSLEGEYIGTYAAEWAQKWGIGQKDKDNGVLLLASIQDRQFWITTGYGLEETLTDAKSSMVYNQIIKPAFQNQNYYQGLDQGTTAIIQILEGQFKAEPEGGSNLERFLPFLIILLFIFIIFRSKHGNRGGGSSGGGWLFDSILLSSLGRGSSSGFGGGSFGGGMGGFGGGFGGGGFGGGGAGGSW